MIELLRNAGVPRKKMKAEARAKAKPMRMTFSARNARCQAALLPQARRSARHVPFFKRSVLFPVALPYPPSRAIAFGASHNYGGG